MDISYERNVTTLLTTIIFNAITIALLGVYEVIKEEFYTDDIFSKESGAIFPSLSTYATTFALLLFQPSRYIKDATIALCNLISGMSVGMPYKYIRLLSDATYFIGHDPQENKQDSIKKNSSTHINGNQTNSDGNSLDNNNQTNNGGYSLDGHIRLPKVWPPKYRPKKLTVTMERIQLLTPPDEIYISDPTFDGFYSVKSTMSCLFGAVQCTSSILVSCMRLQNMDTVHTMDVLSMYTSYILFCIIIGISFHPSYYCKPVVCLPEAKLKTYTTISNELSSRDLRLCIHSFFNQYHGYGRLLIHSILLIPICLMVSLLVYINRNNTLLLSLSAVWVFLSAIGCVFVMVPDFSPLERCTYLLALIQAPAASGLLVILIVFSCLYATPEQKYPSNVNWLPHF
jgi:hypothetical protein